MSKNTVARYLRVDKLIPALKMRLDKEEIGMRVAEALSYLRNEEQEIIESFLVQGKRISIKQADELHSESKKEKLNKAYIKRVLEAGYFGSKIKPIKFNGKFLSQFFVENQSSEEIESTIEEAIKLYFANK